MRVRSAPKTACFSNRNYVEDSENYVSIYKTFNGKSDVPFDMFDNDQFIMNDGMFVMLENYRAGEIVNVNGMARGTNRWGQDLFTFDVKNGKVLPMGTKETGYGACSMISDNTYNGAKCTYKAFIDENYFKNLPR